MNFHPLKSYTRTNGPTDSSHVFWLSSSTQWNLFTEFIQLQSVEVPLRGRGVPTSYSRRFVWDCAVSRLLKQPCAKLLTRWGAQMACAFNHAMQVRLGRCPHVLLQVYGILPRGASLAMRIASTHSAYMYAFHPGMFPLSLVCAYP
jgi:hypothetical protein